MDPEVASPHHGPVSRLRFTFPLTTWQSLLIPCFYPDLWEFMPEWLALCDSELLVGANPGFRTVLCCFLSHLLYGDFVFDVSLLLVFCFLAIPIPIWKRSHCKEPCHRAYRPHSEEKNMIGCLLCVGVWKQFDENSIFFTNTHTAFLYAVKCFAWVNTQCGWATLNCPTARHWEYFSDAQEVLLQDVS